LNDIKNEGIIMSENNNFSIDKGELKDFKKWSKEGFKLFFRNPMYSFFGMLFIVSSFYLMNFSGALFFIFIFVLLPMINFSLVYLNDNSYSINKIQPYYFKYVKLEHLMLPFFIMAFHFISSMFPEADNSNKEETTAIVGFLLYVMLPFITSIFISHFYVSIFSQHIFRYFPALHYGFHLNYQSDEYKKYVSQVDDGYEDNKINIYIFSIPIFFIITLLYLLFKPTAIIMFISLSFAVVFIECVIYTMVKELIGAGGIKEKETSKVNVESLNLQPIPIKTER
jgi:hypothetical protein